MGKEELTWREVIDYHLIEIGRNIDEHVNGPLLGTIILAIVLSEDLEYFNSPGPTEVYVDHFGGIVFERNLGNKKIIMTVINNGSVEYLALGFRGGVRRKIIPRCKTPKENYWAIWICEGGNFAYKE